MKTKSIVLILLLLHANSFAQKVDKLIKAKSISRVIKSLSSDEMLGRSALVPEQIESATVFIEKQFKKAGLRPLKDLKGFRQEFVLERVSPDSIQAVVNARQIPSDDLIVLSDNKQIHLSGSQPVVSLLYDSSVSNKNQHFFRSAIQFMNDTSTGVMLVSPEYRQGFSQFKGYFEKHFAENRESDKVWILHDGPVESYSINVAQRIERLPMNNVAGMIPGKTKPGEIVLFSAHYDHIGILPDVAGDSIANGADDDASGTTAVIELARYFSRVGNNDRTIIFVAFTAEEVGGFGSKHFSGQMDPDDIVAMFNIEMIGKPSKWGQNAAFITGYERSDLGPILAKNVAGSGFTFHPDPYPEQNLFYRSDNATLARLGVPAHTISTDQIDTDKFYHTVDDEFETIDIGNIVATIRAIVIGSTPVINGTHTPSRVDKASVH